MKNQSHRYSDKASQMVGRHFGRIRHALGADGLLYKVLWGRNSMNKFLVNSWL